MLDAIRVTSTCSTLTKFLSPMLVRNFGEIQFDWNRCRLEFRVLDTKEGKTLLSHSLDW